MKKGTLKQILLITDGCSNQGEDPVAMAALAREQGVAVNVVGVLDRFDTQEDRALREVEEIARAGGGISQIVQTHQLVQTVQTVTRQAMTQTIRGVVNRELQDILGHEKAVEDLPPEKQGKIMEVVDEMGEQADLIVCILVDTSASMKSKLATVKEALTDLSLSLSARMGDNLFALYLFPGKRQPVRRAVGWTRKLEHIEHAFAKVGARGVTPTGPALREALKSFDRSAGRNLSADDENYNDEAR